MLHRKPFDNIAMFWAAEKCVLPIPNSVGFTVFKLAIGYTTRPCKTGAAEHGTLQLIVVAYKRLAETCPDRKIRTYHRRVLCGVQLTYAATNPDGKLRDWKPWPP